MKLTSFKSALKVALLSILLFGSLSLGSVHAGNTVNLQPGPLAPNTTSTAPTGGQLGGLSVAPDEGGLAIPNAGIIDPSISQRSFADTLLLMVNYFIGFLGFLATLAFVYAGVLWVLSGGSEELITKAKKIMTYAALGIIVVILSASIVTFITDSAGDDPSSGGQTGAQQTTTPPQPGAPGSCSTDADCSGNQECRNVIATGANECVDRSLLQPPVCTVDSDCGSGELCDETIDQCVPGLDGDPPPVLGDPGCQDDAACIRLNPLRPVCVADPVRGVNECVAGPELDSCTSGGGCSSGFICDATDRCVPEDGVLPPDPDAPGACQTDLDCSGSQECRFDQGSGENVCSAPNTLDQCSVAGCDNGFVCDQGSNTCIPADAWNPPDGGALGCENNSDCDSGEICSYSQADHYNYCVPEDPLTGCATNNDCPINYSCSTRTNRCSFDPDGGDRDQDRGGTSEENTSTSQDNIDRADDLIGDVADDLDISNLPQDLQDQIRDQLSGGNIDQKIANLEDMVANPDDYGLSASDVRALEQVIRGLEKLKILRDEFDELRIDMPESAAIIAAYNSASDTLDELMDDPVNIVLMRRFTNRYRDLRDLIQRFPVVRAVIRAIPVTGNAPLTVQLDGLDSIDPTGGTISEYKWTFLNNSGQEESLGSQSLVLHEFDEPNTYVVRLRASTSNRDDEGYKTAGDGVATMRIKVLPPASEVRFRINGVEVSDVYHVTLEEAQNGLTFDPGPTAPAPGRTIDRYTWTYGDTFSEERSLPTTVVHGYEKAGEYFVKLEVTDNLNVKDKKIVKLFIKSLAADVQVSPATGDVNTVYKFSGANSRSDDGFIRDFEWEIQDGDNRTVFESSEPTFSNQFDSPGIYKVRLTVTDLLGASDTLIEEFEVASRNPNASFRFKAPETNHPNLFEFNAIDSYDPDEGDQLTYSWDFDGDGDFELVATDESLVRYTYERVGEYRAKLQVEDAFGKRDQTEKKISVTSTLSGDIQADKRAIRVGEPLDFSVESEQAVVYLWEFGDGETFTSEGTRASHTFNRTGKFKVKVNFFDRDDNDNSDTIRILVGPGDEPLAAINHRVSGQDPVIIDDLCGDGQEGTLVTRADTIRFSGGDSINTDGSSRLLGYDWRFPDGQRSSSREASYKFDEINLQGECFKVTLVVRDQAEGKLSQQNDLHFKVANELPTITDFVIDAPVVENLVTPTKVKLRVINPKDTDGSIKKYRWWYYREGFPGEKLGVHTTAEPITEMIITSFGEADLTNRYFFVVEVTDNDNGMISSEERFGEVSYLDVSNGPNLSPVADFTVDKATISVGDSISFISRSYDPQGEELLREAFRWDFDGDGQFDDISSGPQLNRQFNTPGEYDVRLKVVHRGLSSSASKTVFVEPTDSLPQAAFTYTVDENEVVFDASNTRFDPDITDPTLRFEWDFDISEDANGNGIKDDDVQSTDQRTTYAYPEKGIYKVRLKVKDSIGMEGVVVRDIDLNLTEEERQQAAYRSIRVTAPKNPITTLDIDVIPATLNVGNSADIKARILNADGTPYTGLVFFEILDGSGTFTPNPVQAEDSKAASVFTSTDKGEVRIRITATETIYGDLNEEAVINVQ